MSATVSRAPAHPALAAVKLRGGKQRCRHYYTIPNMGPENKYCVYNNDIVSLERAVKERVFYVERPEGFVAPPAPIVDFDETLRYESVRLRRLLPPTTPVDYSTFVSMYRGRKAEIYQRAVDSLLRQPVRRRDSFVKSFVKAEKAKPGSAPRVIQPRSPRYNVEVGRYLKPLEDQVYRALGEMWGGPTVMKGYNMREVAGCFRAAWDEFSSPVAVGLDASRFDQHVSVEALRWEHSRYLGCFRGADRKKLGRLLRWQLVNKAFANTSDGRLRYTVRGCRMSGDMNTALGNCLLMCSLVHAYCRRVRVRARLLNNGDDCVVIFEKRHVSRFMRDLDGFFTDHGFTMKCEKPVYDFDSIEFCQARPVFDGVDWLMVRGLNAFIKDSISLFPLDTPDNCKLWTESVAKGGLAMTGGIPIWENYYRRMLRISESVRIRRPKRYDMRKARRMSQAAFVQSDPGYKCWGMNRKAGVTQQARYSFYVSFGVTPDEQLAVEELLDITPLPKMCDEQEGGWQVPLHSLF